jgi:TRAP transporter TAXI family solute receptor
MALRIGTAEPDGTFHSQGLALAQVLERNEVSVEVVATSRASIENANRLHAGELDFGFMASNWLGRAKLGAAPFEYPIDLRMVAPMNAGPLFFIVRADSAIQTIDQLRGRRVAVGLEASGMTQHAHAIFNAIGISFADIIPIYLDFAAGADALAGGEVDAQFQCPIPNKVMTALSERTAVRVLAYASGQLEAVLQALPSYRRTVMRKDAIRGLDADLPQLAVVNVLASHARVPEAMVRNTVKTIVTHSDELGRLNPLFLGLDDLLQPLRSEGAAALEFGGVPLHPGALAAYRDSGLLLRG